MKKLQPVRGTRDILEEDSLELTSIILLWSNIAKLYGFNSVETPILEDSEVFKKTLGRTSDIIKKETYTFKDRSNNEITLRPEGTAPILRLCINNSSKLTQQPRPYKFSYAGPMFRYDRPQKGRYRQFYQFGAETIGEKDIYADIELINLAKNFVNITGVTDKSFKIHVNSLGDEVSRKKYILELKNFFQDHKKNLTPESLERLKKNPLRILDTKNEKEKKLLVKAPKIKNFLSSESSDIFEEFKEGCKQLKIPIVLNDNLVRGLDYYNSICYEFVSSNIGAQDSFLAGGRYDGLMKKMGGVDYPGCGFAIGVERLLMISTINQEIHKKQPVPSVVIAVGKESKFKAMEITNKLRKFINETPKYDPLNIDFICTKSLFDGINYAITKNPFNQEIISNKSDGRVDKPYIKFAIIIGQEEISKKEVTIQNLQKKTQKRVKSNNIAAILNEIQE